MLASLVLSAALLVQLPGQSGCLSAHHLRGCGRVPALRGVHSLAATPDTVFAAGQSAITALRRDPATGALSYAGSTPHGVAGGGVVLALSPDGAFLYATSEIGTTWYPASGPLRALGSVSGYGGTSIAVSPDGLHAFTAGAAGVLAFSRDPATGALTLRSVDGTYKDLFQLAAAPDGRNLYAISQDALVMLAVAPDGSLTRLGEVLGRDDLRDLQVSPDGRTLAVAENGRLETWARDPDGRLSPLRCDYATDTPAHRTIRGCRPATFDAADALAYTPDGRLVVGGEFNTGLVAGDTLRPLACLNDVDDGLDRRCRRARGIQFPLALAAQDGNVYLASRGDTVATLVPGKR